MKYLVLYKEKSLLQPIEPIDSSAIVMPAKGVRCEMFDTIDEAKEFAKANELTYEEFANEN